MGAKYFEPENNIIFKTLVGSRLYGIHTEDSDYDYTSVCIAPIEQYLSNQSFEQTEHQSDEEDYTIYDIKKAVKLMADNNPNMIELLYIPDKYIIKTTKFWNKLRENRDLFLSKKAKYTFGGYAHSQLKRLKRHKQWIDGNYEKPKREDYNLGDTNPINNKYEKAILSLPNKFITDDLKPRIRRERKFRNAMKEWKKYKNWKENRNRERYKLEKEIGYDAKHATHLYRLLKMGIEILNEGTIHVDRRGIDADVLKEIRNCEWEYEKLINKVEEMDNKLDELYEESDLQYSPQRNKIEELMLEIIKDYNKEPTICQNLISFVKNAMKSLKNLF